MEIFSSPLMWRLLVLALVGVLGVGAVSADAPKSKVLESFRSINPKTLQFIDSKAQVVSTADKDHPKVVELVMDYAAAGGSPGMVKLIPAGTVDLQKYSEIRYWVRSDCGTQYTLQIDGRYPRKDGKRNAFSPVLPKPTTEWTQVILPLESLKRHHAGSIKDNVRIPGPGGGEPPDTQDYAGLSSVLMSFRFVSNISLRGTSTVGHLMFDGLELVEKVSAR